MTESEMIKTYEKALHGSVNFTTWVTGKVLCGKEAEISLALLERQYPEDFPAKMSAIKDWADQLCKQLGCTATIHVPSDIITFYPRSKA